jgi:preprotein translocase subunit SecA
VYVVTPNEYLSERDARRARPFSDEIGVRVGLCTTRTGTHHAQDPEWSAQVVYTTFQELMNKCLRDDLGATEPENPIVFGAVLLDEVDAILLDEESDLHQITTHVRRESLEWQRAFSLARTVTAEDVTNRFAEGWGVRLRPAAWRRLADEQITPDTDPWTLTRLVEAAYTALHVVKEDVDYVISGRRAVLVDQATGLRRPGVRPEWLAAVQHRHGLPEEPKSQELFSRGRLTTVARFREVAGASGTAGYVLLDMFLALGAKAIPSVIAPRVERYEGQVDDLVYLDTEHAFREAAAQAIHEVRTRPVLVGALSRHHAYRFVAALHEAGHPHDAYTLILEGDAWGSDPFASSGQVGALTITTLFAARGTDIVLSQDAIAAGGLHLIVLGRTREGRLDRQFLGRAGRQGQRFSATFFSSLEMEMFRDASAPVEAIYKGLGLPPDMPVQSKLVSRALRDRQAAFGNLSRWKLARMAQESALRSPLEDEFVHGMNFVRRFCRTRVPSGADDARAVVDELVRSFVDEHVAGKEAGPALAVIQESIIDVDMDAMRSCIRERALDPDAVRTTLVGQVEDQLRKWAEVVRSYAAQEETVEELRATQRALQQWLSDRAEADGKGAVAIEADGEVRVLSMDEARATNQRWLAVTREHGDGDVDTAVLAVEAARRYRFSGPIGTTERKREPSQGLKYAVIDAWRRVQREIARQTFDIDSKNDPVPVQQYRRALMYQEAQPRLRTGIEIGLLNALMRCGEPSRNGELFRLLEERVPVPEPEYDRSPVPWAPRPPAETADTDPVESLIQSFVAEEQRVGQGIENVELLIRKFLHGAPWPSLGSASQCAAHLVRWSSEQRAIGVPRRSVSQQVGTLSRFLAHAADRNAIPEAATRSRIAAARGARVVSGIRSVRIGFGAAQLIVLLGLLLALGLVRPLDWGIDADGALGVLDRWLLWGGLQSGSLAGPWLVVTSASYALRAMFGISQSQHAAYKAGIVSLLCVAGALLAGALLAVLWAVVVFPVSIVAWRYLESLRGQHSLEVDALLIASSSVAFFARTITAGGGESHVPTLVLVVAMLLAARLSRLRIPVLGGHVTTLDEAVERRESTFGVNLGVDLRTHALVAAVSGVSWWSLWLAAGRSGVSPLAGVFVYAGCYGLVAVLATWRTLRPATLTDRLHGLRLQLSAAGARVLRQGRIRVSVIEAALALCILLVGAWGVVAGDSLALAPILWVPATALCARAVLDGAGSLAHVVVGTSAGIVTARELRATEPAGSRDPRPRWKRLASRAGVVGFAVYVGLVHLLDVVGVLAFLRDMLERLLLTTGGP